MVQLDAAAIVPPIRLTLVAPAAGAKVPPQLSTTPGVPATTSPAGKLSVNPTPVNAVDEFGLVRVKFRVVVPPRATPGFANDLLMVGGESTVMLADATLPLIGSVLSPAVNVPEMLPVVFALSPALVGATATENEHDPAPFRVRVNKLIVLLPAFA
jgi:hypothetical protein